ncbi:uncharacterized protein LY79DRAFT_223662 [Colletotrichum navitas]|uniref:Uncharacterized protein n=1 Tax=Colletotrichum navitas TaxID=681940 RepID=A0AAD8PYU1_9PEZI|nr:uncharacterized protein LY79DRAFT_223662 [Colletotrichum navitas]KAK1590167.1 hypothetical protein LY79DRAFT_223662 [Colletotrichum navitas]
MCARATSAFIFILEVCLRAWARFIPCLSLGDEVLEAAVLDFSPSDKRLFDLLKGSKRSNREFNNVIIRLLSDYIE